MHAERQACKFREIPFRKIRYRREPAISWNSLCSFGASSSCIFSISVICSLQSREDSLDCNHSNFWHLVTVLPLRLLRGMFFVPAAGYVFKRSVRRSAGIVRMTWIVLRFPCLRLRLLCRLGFYVCMSSSVCTVWPAARRPNSSGKRLSKIHAAACHEFA